MSPTAEWGTLLFIFIAMKSNKTLIALFFLLFSSGILPQQFTRSIDYSVFTDSLITLGNPFSGGHNNIKTQFADIDGDGDYDLIYLDGDGTFGWYRNIGTPQQPVYILQTGMPEAAAMFNWFRLADIDSDGDADLFTGSSDNQVRWFMNTGSVTAPRFTLSADPLLTSSGQPVISESGCHPAFTDVDSDGDLDFITGNSTGTLTFYKNTGTPQQFVFEFVTDTWLNIIIIGGTARHGASAIEFGDIDGDGDEDMLWGDFFSKSMYYLENTGSSVNPLYTVSTEVFPMNEDSIVTSGFNMPRFTDIDADGDLDLFVSVLYDPTVPQALMFYENTGSAALHNFRLRNPDYLRTVDGGIQSFISMTDINGDGKKDLFLSNAQNPEGSIYYFQNVSASGNAEYILVSKEFAGIRGELSLAAEFGDLNSDGLCDLLVGNFDGTLSFYRNEGTIATPQFASPVILSDSSTQVIDVGIYARPRLFDFDNDGDKDLFIGAFNGRIRIFRNTGTPQSYSFVNADAEFSLPDIGDNSSPFLYDFDGDGKVDLFAGNKNGKIWQFRNAGNNSVPEWQLVTGDFISSLRGIDVTPFLIDFDLDGDPDFLAGNYRGGLLLYLNDEITFAENSDVGVLDYGALRAYPNPFNPDFVIEYFSSVNEEITLTLYSTAGEEVKTIYAGQAVFGRNRFSDDFTGRGLASGMYFVQKRGKNGILTVKILYLK